MYNTEIFVLLASIFMHIVDDYYLQGILASMKQKSWWLPSENWELYKNDYKVALFMHSFSWTFMVMLIPVLYYSSLPLWLFAINVAIHMYIDDLKANKKKINLVQDQSIHMLQIIITNLIMWV